MRLIGEAAWLSWLEHSVHTRGVTGSNPVAATIFSIIVWEFSSAGRASALQAGGHRFEPCNSHQFGQVVQLVRMPACHAGGRRFEPDLGRHFFELNNMVGIVKRLRPRVVAPVFVGSNPTTHPIFLFIGVSPSGKATDSDSVIRRFESCYPSQYSAG